jgi:hypothetical protein
VEEKKKKLSTKKNKKMELRISCRGRQNEKYNKKKENMGEEWVLQDEERRDLA